MLRLVSVIAAMLFAAFLWALGCLPGDVALFVPIAFFLSCYPCCDTCTIFEDDFATDRTGTDYTVVSGTPTVSGGVLTTTSAGFLIVENTAGTTGRGHVTITVKQTTAGGSARIVGSYVDSSNYLFGELTINGASSTLILWKKVAGVDTQVGTTATFTGSTGTNYTMHLCWTGSSANVAISGFAAFGSYTGTANQAGFGASPNGGTATFDNFIFTKHTNDDVTCTSCSGSCVDCTSGTTPNRSQLVITGMANGTCTTCTSMNATYLFDKVEDGTSGTVCYFYNDMPTITCAGQTMDEVHMIYFGGNISAFFTNVGALNIRVTVGGNPAAPRNCSTSQTLSSNELTAWCGPTRCTCAGIVGTLTFVA